MSEAPTWRDRYPEGHATCMRCLEVFDLMDLDRMLWCASCRLRARYRAVRWGWLGGLLFGAGVGVYVWVVIRPSDLIVSAWIATLVAAVWISSKVAREMAYGLMRFRNARAVDAAPPSADPGSADGEPAP